MAGGGIARGLLVGAAEYDPASKTLRVDDRLTLLDRRAADVFMLLLERKGQRVSKDELLATAWQGRLVHENSIAKVISKLRAALKGSGVSITASYGIGYILSDNSTQDRKVSSTTPDVELIVSRRSRRAPLIAGGLAAALLAVTTIVTVNAPRTTEVPVRQTWPTTNDPPDATATLLWVDDHPENNRLDVVAFERNRLAVHLAQSTTDALKLLAINRYQLVISDLGRGDDRLAGLKMIDEMKQRRIAVPVIIYTLRPKTVSGQTAQRELIRKGGAADLAVTPQEVRAKVLDRLPPKT